MNKRLSVYDELFRRADDTLKTSSSVILDATFITQELRLQAAAVAAKNQKTLVILETMCPQEMSIAHILRRTREKYESNALTEQAYLNNKTKFEQVNIDEIKQAYPKLQVTHILVDTAGGETGQLYITRIEKI